MQPFCHPVATAGGPAARARLCIAAGAAAASVSVVAGPMPVPGADASQIRRGVELTASWSDVSAAAVANATDIWDHFSAKPFPAIQQVLANQVGYVEDLIRNPGDFSTVLSDIRDHVAAVFGAPATGDAPAVPGALFGPFLPDAVATESLYQSLDPVVTSTGTGLFELIFFNHEQLYGLLDTFLPDLLPALGLEETDLPLVQSAFDFLGSPSSGILIGELGTMLSPVLQFNDDLAAISDALSGAAPDWSVAFQHLGDMPADITGAFLNGYGTVDLMPILDQLGVTLPMLNLLGEASTIDGLEINLGGLLSSGGSLFDSVGVDVTVGDLGSFDLPGVAVGPIASMVELGQAIAEALGWDGTGALL